jgi:hypothetical protein
MAYFRYICMAMLLSLVFLAGCANWNWAIRDPVAQSGASSEEIWYRKGGARVAYTAVARPKQLHTDYGVVWDPALYELAPATVRAAQKKPSAPKVPTAPPDCPPCSPTDAAATVPQNLRPASSAPVQVSGSAVLPSSTTLDPASGGSVDPPATPRIPLPGMPTATPAPMTPDTPGR